MYWDAVTKRERFTERLRRLPKPKIVSFVGGCAAHALERFEREQALQSAPYVRDVADALKRFWSDLRSNPQAAARQVLVLQPLIPDDDAGDADALLPGRYDLVMAAIYACECAEKPDVEKARDAAAHAYQAVCDVELRPHETSRAEAELDAAERGNAACREEIAFQLAYLSALEQLPADAPSDLATVREFLPR